MIQECFKICGLDYDEISSRLKSYENKGIDFKVEEKNLDAKINLSSNLEYYQFGILKSQIYNLFEEEVYASMDISLPELAGKYLKINHKTLGIAESLTGGEICSLMASISGISENFFEGIVCYNKKSKVERLKVSLQTLDNFGAISKETAYEMVQGICNNAVDIGLSTTGLAGPNADEGKPVGLVYIGVGFGEFITVFERHFKGNRNEIRNKATNVALFYLIRYLKGDILRL